MNKFLYITYIILAFNLYSFAGYSSSKKEMWKRAMGNFCTPQKFKLLNHKKRVILLRQTLLESDLEVLIKRINKMEAEVAKAIQAYKSTRRRLDRIRTLNNLKRIQRKINSLRTSIDKQSRLLHRFIRLGEVVSKQLKLWNERCIRKKKR